MMWSHICGLHVAIGKNMYGSEKHDDASTRVATVKNILKIETVGEDVEKLESLCIVGGNVK